MDIISYLTDLLKTQKKVGIEGLGTFLIEKKPGKYDVEKHLFVPPSYKLNFTAEVKGQANLTEYIVKARNISEESARNDIRLFSESINRQMAASGEADLGSLGKLTSINNDWVILQEGEPDFGFEFYGLPKISVATPDETLPNPNNSNASGPVTDNQEIFEEIGEPEPVKPEVPLVEIETPEGKIGDNIMQDIPTSSQPEGRALVAEPSAEGAANIWHFDSANASPSDSAKEPIQNQDTQKSSASAWIKGTIVVVILLVVLAVTYFLKPTWFTNEQDVTVANKPVDSIKNVMPLGIDTTFIADSTNNTDSTLIVDTTKQAQEVVKSHKVETMPATWEIIGASLTKSEVKKYVRDMKAIGYTVKVIPNLPGTKRIKMSIATFYNEEGAKEGRKALIKKLKNKDLYIYYNKNTQKPL